MGAPEGKDSPTEMERENLRVASAPFVFISYFQKPLEHKEKVRAFAARLAKDGIDVVIDIDEEPEEGWPAWSRRQIETSDYVLIVISPGYASEDTGGPDHEGRGSAWELYLIEQLLYRSRGKSRQFIPVVFSDEHVKIIPPFLGGFSYHVAGTEAGYLALLKSLRRPRVKGAATPISPLQAAVQAVVSSTWPRMKPAPDPAAIYPHGSSPQALFLRNLHRNPRLEEMLPHHRDKPMRILSIWGAKHDKDRIDYHLGHLYVMQKLHDFYNNPMVRTELFLGINPMASFTDPERARRQAEYLECTEKLIRSVLGDRIRIDNCLKSTDLAEVRGACEQARRTYSEVIEKLVNIFGPERVMRIRTSPQDVDQEVILNELVAAFEISRENAENLFEDLRAFFSTKKPWLHAQSEQEHRRQLFVYIHAIAKPHCILVSTRHLVQWRWYQAVLWLGKMNPVPELILLDAFRDPFDDEPMRSGGRMPMFVMDLPSESREKLEYASTSYDYFLPQCFNYLIFPQQEEVEVVSSGPEHRKIVLKAPWNLPRYREQRLGTREIQAACEQQLLRLLERYRQVVTKARQSFYDSHTGWISLTNAQCLARAASWCGAALEDQSGLARILDEQPEAFSDLYWQTIDRVCGFLTAKVATTVGRSESLGRLFELVQRMKELDVYHWLTEKTYRDEYSHVINVGVCGQVLFSHIQAEGQTLGALSRKLLGWEKKQPLLDEVTWWLTALLHDHAYPISHFLRYFGPRIYVERPRPGGTRESLPDSWLSFSTSLADLVQRLAGGRLRTLLQNLHEGERFTDLASYRKKVQTELANLIRKHHLLREPGLQASGLGWDATVDHGVLAALNLYEFADAESRLRSKDKNSWQPVDFIADAIAVHNHSGLRSTLSFEDNPFAYVLALADEIQEWGRSALGEDYIHPIAKVDIGPFFEEQGRMTSLPDRRLKVRFFVADAFRRQELRWSLERFEKSKNDTFKRLSLPVLDSTKLEPPPDSPEATEDFTGFEGGPRELLLAIDYELRMEGMRFHGGS